MIVEVLVEKDDDEVGEEKQQRQRVYIPLKLELLRFYSELYDTGNIAGAVS